MAEFLAAVAIFLAAHIVPPLPPVRARLVRLLGRSGYVGLYSALSVALLVWVIVAARRAPYLPLWSPAPWQALVPITAMPVASWLLVAGLSAPNPLSISLRSPGQGEVAGLATTVTRHPVLWALLLWAGSHLVPNGDVVSVILFGGLSALSLAGLFLVDRRVRRRLGEARWTALASGTSMVPFVALATGRARVRFSLRDGIGLAAAVGFYVWFLLVGHAALIGPDPLAWVSW